MAYHTLHYFSRKILKKKICRLLSQHITASIHLYIKIEYLKYSTIFIFINMKNQKFHICICKVTPKVKVLSNKISTRQYISYLYHMYSNTKYRSILKIYTMLCTFVSSTFGLWLHLAYSYLRNSQICYMNVAMFQTRIFLSNIQ